MAVDTFSFILLSFTSVFVIINPMGAGIIYVSMTDSFDHETRRRVALEACWTAFVILVVFALLGGVILQLFGITLAAFRIGGGILLFMIGLDMVFAKVSRAKMTATEKYEGDADDVSVMPLAIPMIAGPGTITTVIVLIARGEAELGLGSYAVVIAAVAFTVGITGLVMLNADRVVSRIGQREFRAVNRIMGILMVAIAVEFVINGLKTAFPFLAGGV